MEAKPKLLIILGPTASGKSDLAVQLAEKFNGEVVSADSRQVYKGLDIGTGKITREEMRGIPHHLLDVVSPYEQYSVSEYKREAEKVIDEILSRRKLPILCGGTGLYIDAVADNILTPETPPNDTLRRELSTKTPTELFSQLQKLDSKRAESIDPKNPRRLIRAIEIASVFGAVPEIPPLPKKYETLKIGLQSDKETLRTRIAARLKGRMEQGMIEESERLHKAGLSFERMDELGLEYRYLAKLLQGKITRENMEKELAVKIEQYAKRQMTWFKRDKHIQWFSLSEKQKVISIVDKFII